MLDGQKSQRSIDKVTYFYVGDLFCIHLGSKFADFQEKIFADIFGRKFQTLYSSNVTYRVCRFLSPCVHMFKNKVSKHHAIRAIVPSHRFSINMKNNVPWLTQRIYGNIFSKKKKTEQWTRSDFQTVSWNYKSARLLFHGMILHILQFMHSISAAWKDWRKIPPLEPLQLWAARG